MKKTEITISGKKQTGGIGIHQLSWYSFACILIFILWKTAFISSLQAQSTDTTLQLREVTIRAYMDERSMLRLPSSVSHIDSHQIACQPVQSAVALVNTVPGVRMEERSPGSYRLSIRGSLLRSPFGIRNVKVYLDEFPFTDAGGNTYLNLIDMSAINGMEVLKGPDGSLFGANSCGVVRIGIPGMQPDSLLIGAGVMAGSYSLKRQQAAFQKRWGRHSLAVRQAWQQSDGYRQQSGMERKYLQLAHRFNYHRAAQIRAFLLYSGLHYETPGGLTYDQWQDNPKMARQPTGQFPGAAAQKAAVYNSTLFGGMVHERKFGGNWRHVLSLSGTDTEFKNPFITNYETRKEQTAALRTYAEATNNSINNIRSKWNLGMEAQQTHSRIRNYGNRQGSRDTIMSAHHMIAGQQFYFTRLSVDLHQRLILEAATSLNFNHYWFGSDYPKTKALQKRAFQPQLMPRLALSYSASSLTAFRASVSRGFSPPSLAEILPSHQVVNTQLQPETGWNYETGMRLRDKNGRLWWDAAVFYYHLQDAIVRRLDETGAEYFVNAGGTRQPGMESELRVWIVAGRKHGTVKGLQLRQAYTYHPFQFRDYRVRDSDFSGNRLTGVPRHIVVTGMQLSLPKNSYLFVQHNYTAGLPLNDANSVWSEDYHLVLVKAGWHLRGKRLLWEFFTGIDNLLNEQYSLGNDINAFGGRYFNAAPLRNYFGGVKVILR